MSDQIRELRAEIIALKENVDKLEGKNHELSKENGKLKEEIETLKAEKSQENAADPTIAIPSTSQQPMKRPQQEEGSNGFVPNIKRPKRFIQNWLIDSLPWIGRKELANSSLSTSSETFRQLCWPKLHGDKVKPHKIPYLEILPGRCELGNVLQAFIRHTLDIVEDDDAEIIPIASIPPPNYITGIELIELKFMNEQVVNFFKSIAHMHQCAILRITKIQLICSKIDKKLGAASLRDFLVFMGANEKNAFMFVEDGPNLNDFNGLFPGIFDQIQFLMVGPILTIDDIDIIMSWLTKQQSNNGKQKNIILSSNNDAAWDKLMANIINPIKDEFPTSISPSIFHICFFLQRWIPNPKC